MEGSKDSWCKGNSSYCKKTDATGNGGNIINRKHSERRSESH